MTQALAIVLLVLIGLGVAKMIFDVQMVKLERTVEKLKQHFDEN